MISVGAGLAAGCCADWPAAATGAAAGGVVGAGACSARAAAAIEIAAVKKSSTKRKCRNGRLRFTMPPLLSLWITNGTPYKFPDGCGTDGSTSNHSLLEIIAVDLAFF